METNFNEIARNHSLFFEEYSEPNRQDEVFEDDGFIHIIRNGTRFSFDIGQEVRRREFIRQANRLLRDLGIRRDEILLK